MKSQLSLADSKVVSECDPEFLSDVLCGLSKPQKTLPCKYFYDTRGSELFEAITQLDEYYLTRTELALLKKRASELSDLIGKNAAIIEPGAGAGIKIQTLLDALDAPSLYVPLDISKAFLFYSAEIIRQKYPQIDIYPIEGDFTQALRWPDDVQNQNRVVFFPGSTIGNFQPQDAAQFLRGLLQLAGPQGSLIVGVDLKKSPVVLEAAYNDAKGVTARFNKNLLVRMNRELDANFDPDSFSHQSIYNQALSRVEMHLVSQRSQVVSVSDHQFQFQEGESIHTENSYKYSLDSFSDLCASAGWQTQHSWTDDAGYFSLHFLTPVAGG